MTVKRTEKSNSETSKNGNRIPIIIDGVSYESIADASRRLGVTRATIERYIRDGKKKPLSGMQKVVIAVISVIILAIVVTIMIIFLNTQSRTSDRQATGFEKASVSSSKKDGSANSDSIYDQITKGDLSSFEGQYSNDALEKAIADSGFTLYTYRPEDYYQNNTTVFPSIKKNAKTNDEWTYWSGSMHAQYKLDPDKLPQKKNDYYEVYFVGANGAAGVGQKMSLILVPPKMKAPDGTTSDERRIFYGTTDKASYRQYHDDWWKNIAEPAEPTSYSVDDILVKNLPLKYDGWKMKQMGGILKITDEDRLKKGRLLENIRRDDDKRWMYYVEVDKLYIRSKPDKNSEIVGHVIKGDVLYGYVGNGEDGSLWLLVNIVSENQKGYICMVNAENKESYLSTFLGQLE
ncbi:hypothetical protein RyT2_23580 [Pseudolactococcus yaeyamensis]